MSQIRRTYTRIVTHEIIRVEPSGSFSMGRCPVCGHEAGSVLTQTGTQTCQTSGEQKEQTGSPYQIKQNEPVPSE